METSDNDIKKSQMEEINSLILGGGDEIYTLKLAFFIFMGLCFINVPLAFFYTSMFVYFSRIKVYNRDVYDTFIITSLSIVAYFVILYIVLQIVCLFSDNQVGVITHNGRFPLFYML
jgi:ABC-type antimicrobial peptide transport system permease subunit